MVIDSIDETFIEHGTGGCRKKGEHGSRNIPTANLIPGNQSLTIDGVKLNYTIRLFSSGIVLFGGSG